MMYPLTIARGLISQRTYIPFKGEFQSFVSPTIGSIFLLRTRDRAPLFN